MRLLSLLLVVLMSVSLMAQGFPANVNVTTVITTQLRPTAWVSGEVVSPNNSTIAAEVNGRVVALAELGTAVNQGEIVARIDDTRLSLRAKEAQASIASSRARYEFLASEVTRIKALEKRNLSAKTELDRTISERDSAKSDVAEAESRLAQIKQDIEFASIRAPFDGLITHRLSNVGEFVQVGAGVIRMVETSNTEASIFVPITSYPFIKLRESLAIDSALGRDEAQVKSLIPVAETRSHLMEIRLDMSSLSWPIGLKIRAAVPNAETKQVVALPRDALVLRRDGVSVFLVRDNKAVQIPVQVGIGQGDLVEVIGDVQPGDQVIIRGAERLFPGQPVNIKESNSHLVSGK
ncbi:MAG: efflux RND transporter periplasmic adaptor subunit [Gammaproteobacteria bacterium]